MVCKGVAGSGPTNDPDRVLVENSSQSTTITLTGGGTFVQLGPGESQTVLFTRPYEPDWTVDTGGTTPTAGEKISFTVLEPDASAPGGVLALSRFDLDLGGETYGVPAIVGFALATGSDTVNVCDLCSPSYVLPLGATGKLQVLDLSMPQLVPASSRWGLGALAALLAGASVLILWWRARERAIATTVR